MAIVIVGGSVTSDAGDEEIETVMMSTCALCRGTGYYMGACCFACGGGS
jgi:hypothetical protein